MSCSQAAHAGLFFEVEKVVPANQPPLAVQAALDEFARSFGVAMERVTVTYDSLVRGALVVGQ